MNIRHAKNTDSLGIYNVHIDSIRHYCSDFYPKASIDAWLQLKSPEEYQNISINKILLVAEENNNEIVGFCLLNTYKKSIDSLYIKPKMEKKGIGKTLLMNAELLAKKNNIETLTLSSTVNAVEFYHHMGYGEDVKNSHKLSNGIELDCVNMTKRIVVQKIRRSKSRSF